jgi:hypothetical protein
MEPDLSAVRVKDPLRLYGAILEHAIARTGGRQPLADR